VEAGTSRVGRGTRPLIVEARKLEKSFGKVPVLKGIDLEVRTGDVLVIIGPSGSGKSTLCRILVGLEPFNSGEIRIEGELLAQAWHGRAGVRFGSRHRALRLSMGLVFQHFTLFPHMTVFENVTLGPRKALKVGRREAEKIASEVLNRVGLAEKYKEYPQMLSGGQQQRVAIARELAMRRKVIFFDEATSALDPELVREVLAVMRELAESGTTMVVVTHEMGFARQVGNWLVFMADGQVVEQGIPSQLFDMPSHDRTRSFLATALQ
jgi:polar amino acid transport system ATP-binding protein